MQSTSWKDIAELCGIAAIIVGLTLVYVEIQQNSRIARAGLMSDSSELQERIYGKLSDPQFAALYVEGYNSPEDLSESEQLQLHALYESVLSIIGRHNILYALGTVEFRSFYADMLAPQFFGAGYGKIWWNERKRSLDKGSTLVQMIDEAVSQAETSNDLIKMNQRIADHINSQ